MTAVDKIRRHLAKLPEGEPFSSRSLWHLTSTENVRQILNRLVKAGEIKRVGRGLFVKPKDIPQLGKILPSITEIAASLAQSTGETIAIHGAEAARQLQLTTQVPMKIVLYTSGKSRTLTIASRTVKLKHVSSAKLIAPNTVAGTTLSALIYLGRKHVTVDTIKKVRNRVSTEDFNRVTSLIERMPAWLADVFYNYKKGNNHE